VRKVDERSHDNSNDKFEDLITYPYSKKKAPTPISTNFKGDK
jgi:hypothetical protein